MRPLIPVPTKGEKLRATWGTQVSNRLTELCAMAPSGVLHREGFGGIGDQPLPKNLRDRPAAGASQLMPFDLSASFENNEDGTQKRLVVKCVNGQVIWCSPTSTLHQDDTPGVQTDVAPWVTIYTGDWEEEITSGTYEVFLHYLLTIEPLWGPGDAISFGAATKIRQKVTAERVPTAQFGPSIFPYEPQGFYYGPNAEILAAWIRLGAVSVSSSGAVSTGQSFHGDLVLNDLFVIDTAGGGGGANPDATSSLSGCWKIATVEDVENQGATSKQLQDCYYNVGGFTKQAVYQAVPDNATGYLCAVFSSGTVSVAVYASLGSVQNDDSKYIVPLYQMNNGKVVLDMRNAPQIQVFEHTL